MELSIIRRDGALLVSPAPPYLTEYLRYFHRGFKLVNYRRVNDFQLRLLHEVLPDGSLITLPGFFEKITQLITENHDICSVQDQRTPLPAIDWKAIQDINWSSVGSAGLRDYQVTPIAEFLTKAQVNPGIVNACGGAGKTIIQAVTYAAFNSLNTILAVPLKEVFNQTYAKFVGLFPNTHIGRVGDGQRDISSQITMTTFRSLESCAVEKCQLLLVDELQNSAGEQISDVISKMSPIRVFGYTATDEGMFNKAEKFIKGMFGERLIYFTYQEGQDSNAVVPMMVYMVRLPDDVMVNATSIDGKLRQGIDQCEARNKLIGQICNRVPNKWQTIVFVNHVKSHLIPLYKHMPIGTSYVHRESSKASVGSFALTAGQQKKVVEKFKDNETQHLLATNAFRAGFDIPNCRVIIQCAGGCSSVEILQEALRGSRILPENTQKALGVDKKTHCVLIDFMDNHDSTLEGMAKKRKAIYEEQGWKVREVSSLDQITWHATE